MDKQDKEIVSVESAEKKPLSSYSKKNWKKLILIYAVIAVALYGLIYYFLMQKNLNPYSYSTKETISPSPKPNLNPNTGNLYKDINSRLKEVIK